MRPFEFPAPKTMIDFSNKKMLISSNEAERWGWTAAAQYAGTRNVHLRIWCVHIIYYTCWCWWWWRCILLVTLVPCVRVGWKDDGTRARLLRVSSRMSVRHCGVRRTKKSKVYSSIFFLFSSSIAKTPPHHIRAPAEWKVKSQNGREPRSSTGESGWEMTR